VGPTTRRDLTSKRLPLQPLVSLPVSWAVLQRPSGLDSALAGVAVDAWLTSETPQWTAAGMGAPVAGPPVAAAPTFGTPSCER
jgi:hypothetical protein